MSHQWKHGQQGRDEIDEVSDNLWAHIFCNVPTFLPGRGPGGPNVDISKMNTEYIDLELIHGNV